MFLFLPSYLKVNYFLIVAISSSITYPLIVIRTVLHDSRNVIKKQTFLNVSRHIYGQSGIRGFYLGLKPDLIRLIPSNAILFVTYEQLKKYL
jgi:hypothetical protein